MVLILILVINQEMYNHAIAYYIFFYAQTCLSMNQLLLDLIAGYLDVTVSSRDALGQKTIVDETGFDPTCGIFC